MVWHCFLLIKPRPNWWELTKKGWRGSRKNVCNLALGTEIFCNEFIAASQFKLSGLGFSCGKLSVLTELKTFTQHKTKSIGIISHNSQKNSKRGYETSESVKFATVLMDQKPFIRESIKATRMKYSPSNIQPFYSAATSKSTFLSEDELMYINEMKNIFTEKRWEIE